MATVVVANLFFWSTLAVWAALLVGKPSDPPAPAGECA
jgi:hypothetical protein